MLASPVRLKLLAVTHPLAFVMIVMRDVDVKDSADQIVKFIILVVAGNGQHTVLICVMIPRGFRWGFRWFGHPVVVLLVACHQNGHSSAAPASIRGMLENTWSPSPPIS